MDFSWDSIKHFWKYEIHFVFQFNPFYFVWKQVFRRKYFLSQKLTCFNFIDQILFLHKMTGHTLIIRLILQLYYVTKYNCILCSSDPHERDTLIVKKFDCTLSSNKGKIHIWFNKRCISMGIKPCRKNTISYTA